MLNGAFKGGGIKVCPEIIVNQNHLILFALCRTNVDPLKSCLRLSRKILDFSLVAFKV